MGETAAKQGAEIVPLLSGVPAQSSALLSIIRPGAADVPLAVGGFASTVYSLPAGHAG